MLRQELFWFVALCLMVPSISLSAVVDIADEQNADEEVSPPVCNDGDDFLPHQTDCNRFYQCAHNIAYNMTCPPGLHFNRETKVCDWPSNVDCTGESDRCIMRRIGRHSDPDADASSIATCPYGYVPLACVSSYPRGSNGNFVDGRQCFAFNKEGNGGIRAIATCVNIDDGDYTFETSGSWETNPVVRCPSGHTLTNCLLRNRSDRFVFAKFTGRRCWTDISCVDADGCFLQATCRRND